MHILDAKCYRKAKCMIAFNILCSSGHKRVAEAWGSPCVRQNSLDTSFC